jgi:hypothetical protein
LGVSALCGTPDRVRSERKIGFAAYSPPAAARIAAHPRGALVQPISYYVFLFIFIFIF